MLADLRDQYGLLSRFVGDSVSADIDSAVRFTIQNFWYNKSLLKIGWVPGIPPSTQESPDTTYDGIGYFTHGLRVVLFLSEIPVALDDAKVIYPESLPHITGTGGV
jgi:hypothetical protein